jgi:hypothetical protein
MEGIDYTVVLADLERRLGGIDAELAAIQEKRTALTRMIADTKRFLVQPDSIRPTNQTQSENGSSSPRTPPVSWKGKFRGQTSFVETAKKLLTLAGEPMTNREMLNALLEGGFKTNSKEPAITLRSVLRRATNDHGTFTYIDNKWGLPEWQAPGQDEATEGAQDANEEGRQRAQPTLLD